MTLIHTDNGTEFRRATKTLTNNEVAAVKRAVETPQSNDIDERKDLTISNNGRAYLKQAKLPEGYWQYALQHAVNARNTVPHSVTNGIPSVSAFGELPPYVKHFKPFECRVKY